MIPPKKGSITRAIYDRFLANKGTKIESPFKSGRGNHITLLRLRCDYGLDIRCLERIPNRKGNIHYWMLAGRQLGEHYEDYRAETNCS